MKFYGRRISWSLLLLLAHHPEDTIHAAPNFSQLITKVSRRSPLTLAKSIPALSIFQIREGASSAERSRHPVVETAVKKKPKKQGRQLSLPKVPNSKALIQGGGFYYGISPKVYSKATEPVPKKLSLSDSMFEALEELRIMRQEMETMRKEMQTMKRKMVAEGDWEGDSEEDREQARLAKRRKAKESEKLAAEIEKWALRMLDEDEEDGWKEVVCSKMMKGSLDPAGRTRAYLKWMKDSREDKAVDEDEMEYPCIKCVSTIDAPIEDVCTYLSQESVYPDYNDVVDKHKDVEEISPSAKICWSQSPQILFLKPRDFVTFCHHRWNKDGSEIVVNQAVEHPEYPANNKEQAGRACRAYALRGANIFERSPDDPEKTIIRIVAHANPGAGVPQWAKKTAVNALAPIEPFKLFHKINQNVKRSRPQLREKLEEVEMVGSTLPDGRSARPAGMAQLGYACFWPNGGGRFEQKRTPMDRLTTDGPAEIKEDVQENMPSQDSSNLSEETRPEVVEQ